MNRREFLGGIGAFGAMTMTTGCATRPIKVTAGDMAWGALLHLGNNMWADWSPDGKYPRSLEEERALIAAGKFELKPKSSLYNMRDYMSADMNYWHKHLELMRDEKLNFVIVDLGEAYAFPSHPELAVNGSLDFDAMRKELDYIRSLGLEPVPKLNFSAGHDQWLRMYHYMVSTPKYYEVVKDIIRDVCEVFETPRYFHLGFDEECFGAVKHRQYAVMRQGELWWHDFLYCVGEVERNGSQAILFSDKICAGREDFFKHMPKSVLQMTWYYGKDFSEKAFTWKPEYEKSQTFEIQRNLPGAIAEIVKAGYDVMPCTSNWSSPEATAAMVKYCREHIPAKQLKGIVTAPWTKPVARDDERTCAAIRQLGAVKF